MTARGSDGETIAAFGMHRHQNLASIRDQIRARTYKFKPLVRRRLLKKTGKLRELRIPTIRDRVALRAIHQKLNSHQLLRPVFRNQSSFAYRPGVPMKHLVDKINKLRLQYSWVMTADVIEFFDRIEPDLAISRLEEMTLDDSISNLIHDALTVPSIDSNGILFENDYDEAFDEKIGLPQGLAISPVLSNIVLLDFDRASWQKGFRILRYADDIIAFCKTREDAVRAHRHCEELLAELGLSIRPLESSEDSKSSRIQPVATGFEFVGLDYQGSVIKPSEEKLLEFEKKIRRILDEQERSGASSIYRSIHSYTDGWFGAYGPFCDEETLRDAAERADQIVLVWMHGKFKTMGLATGTGSFKKGRGRFLSPHVAITAERQSRRGRR